MKKKVWIAILTAAVVIGSVLGTGAAFAKHGSDDGVKKPTISSTTQNQKMIGVANAKKIALAVVPGKVRSVELELEHGVKYYKVKIIKDNSRYVLLVNAYSGKAWSIK
jgi:uncharacterized membrane protein YkoI